MPPKAASKRKANDANRAGPTGAAPDDRKKPKSTSTKPKRKVSDRVHTEQRSADSEEEDQEEAGCPPPFCAVVDSRCVREDSDADDDAVAVSNPSSKDRAQPTATTTAAAAAASAPHTPSELPSCMPGMVAAASAGACSACVAVLSTRSSR